MLFAAAVDHHEVVTQALPSGTVTFLFTDVEGSTNLLHERGAEGYADALAEHRRVLREAFGMHGGVEVDTQGDAFFVAFSDAQGAVAAAASAQTALASGPIRVRMGLHTGKPHLSEEGYVGEDVHLGARIAAAGHGGQVLLSLPTRELVGGDVSDLGEHKLKDFAEPVWLFQLGSERFPPLRTISNTNLPRPASSFVGRDKEVEELATLLRDGARFVTLTGPGGSGKTRLAIEAAAELVPDFKNGVFWVGLATIRDPGLVAETVAQTLGAKDGLAAWIGERELLLLLDNLEQVIDAAPELAALVETCPNLHLLVTSRELLRVRGEVDYPVLPLADPEAVALFAARARVEPNETVGELCRRLDNLPLALELAAARTSVLSPVQILDRLSQRLDLLKGGRDADPRQQTLRTTIEWSYDLLTDAEKQLFARLSVFRGGATLEAAEEVAGADIDTLQSLVDKSLVRHTGERFWMLETIREYAIEQLDEPELQRRHADCYLSLAEEAYPHLRGDPKEWLDLLDSEHDNLRAALDYLEVGNTEGLLELAGALWKFWNLRGFGLEGSARLETALRAAPRASAARVRALNGATALAIAAGDMETARTRAQEALAMSRELGDDFAIAVSTQLLGNVEAASENLEEARDLFERALAEFEGCGDDHYVLLATRLVAWMSYDLGDHSRARALHESVVSRARTVGNRRMLATSLGALSEYALEERQVAEALPMLDEATQITHDIGDYEEVLANLCRFARAFALSGQSERASMLLGAAEQGFRETGTQIAYWIVQLNEMTAAMLREELDANEYREAYERGCGLSVEGAVALALGTTQAL